LQAGKQISVKEAQSVWCILNFSNKKNLTTNYMKKLFTLAMMLLLAGNTLQAQVIVNDKDKDKDKNKSRSSGRQVVIENDDDDDDDWNDGDSKTVEFKTKFASNKDRKVVFEMDKSRVNIEGYDGDELLITAVGVKEPPKRAEGLKPLYNTAVDNSGIGLAVTQENNIMRVVKASRHDARYTVKVPRKTAVMYEEVNWNGGNVSIANIEGDVEVKLNNSSMKLMNVSGPLTANTTNGNIVVVFSNLAQEKPTSLRAINGHIDVTLPANAKTTLKMGTHNGEVYTDFDVDIKNKGDLKKVGGNTIEGTTNGGGVALTLSTINSNIYLRKKK
jgi:hypothetical protein